MIEVSLYYKVFFNLNPANYNSLALMLKHRETEEYSLFSN